MRIWSGDAIGDEDFISDAAKWKPDTARKANAETVARHFAQVAEKPSLSNARPTPNSSNKTKKVGKQSGRRGRVRPEGF